MSNLLKSLKAQWKLSKKGTISRVPLYHQIYLVLKESILDGTISYNSKMPTEQQLVAMFDISRITAKRAMDELAAEKLIVRFRGKGSHVIYHFKPTPVKAPLVGMLENLAEMSKHSTVRILSIDKTIPPAEIRGKLGLNNDGIAHKLVRVRSNEDNDPYAYYVSWTKGISKGFTKRNLVKSSRLDILKQNGIKLTRVEQTLSAENATLRIAEELCVDIGTALLTITRLSYDNDSNVVDVLYGLYNPALFEYAMELSLD